MQRFVTTIFALLLVLGAHAPVPASRAIARDGSASVVWIAREKSQQVHADALAASAHPAPSPAASYQSVRDANNTDNSLFQRPPPAAL
jgi:hypothetical protein